MKLNTKSKSKKPMTEEELIEARDALQTIKSKQEALRGEEIQIREYLAEKLHDGEEGSKTITVGTTKVSITRVLNRTIAKDEAERMKQENPKLYAELLSWRPEVKTSAFREHEKAASAYVVTKAGPSSVVFK